MDAGANPSQHGFGYALAEVARNAGESDTGGSLMTMTGRARIEAAFSEEGTPEVAAVVPYEDLYVRDCWERLTDRPWWHQAHPSIEVQLQWRAEIRAHLRHDWCYLPGFYSTEGRQSIVIETRPDGVFRVDKRTGETVRIDPPRVGGWSAAGRVASFKPERLPETLADIDALIPSPTGGESELERRDELAKRMLSGFARDLYPISQVSSPLWSCYGLWGFEGLMTMTATRPDLVRHACQRFLPGAAHAARQAARLGAAAIWIEECLTDQISPQAFASLNVPFVRELVDEIHAAGLRSIYYFCGNPAGKWEHLLAAGADALALEEGKKDFAIDIDDVVDRVRGRCVVLGNLDAVGVLQDGSEERLRAEIARQIAAGRRNGSRFIMSVGSPVTPGTPPERFRLYCDLVHDMGAP